MSDTRPPRTKQRASPRKHARAVIGRGPSHDQLYDLASQQAGYFTRDQALASGFSDPLLFHHVQRGFFVRVRRGLYRFRQFPSFPRKEVIEAWLIVGPKDAVVSHESALEILGLSDVIPNRIHLLVPRIRRSRRPITGVAIHTTKEPLRKGEVVVRDGIPVTAASRAIIDAADTGIAQEQVVLAVRQAIEKGLTSPADLRRGATHRGAIVRDLIEQALTEATHT